MYYIPWHIALKQFGEVKMKHWMAVLSLAVATAAGFAGRMVMQADASPPSCVKIMTAEDIKNLCQSSSDGACTSNMTSLPNVMVLSESILGDAAQSATFRAEALKLVALCGQIQSQR